MLQMGYSDKRGFYLTLSCTPLGKDRDKFQPPEAREVQLPP